MSKLICDICGTSYSASEDKCPTCGYARAIAESAYEEEMTQAPRERVRGGRFSKKNVRKRMKLQAQTAAAETAAAAMEELQPLEEPAKVRESEMVTFAETPESPEPAEEAAIQPAQEATIQPVEQPEADLAEKFGAAFAAMTIDQQSETAEEPAGDSAEEPAEEPEPEEEVFPVIIPEPGVPEVSDEEPVEEVNADLPEKDAEEEAEAFIPVILPVEESTPAAEVPEEPEKEKEKKKGGLLLHVVLFASVAVFLASAIYLLVNYAIPYLKDMNWPTQAIVETTVPTEESTDVPTEEPTAAPTQEPTEPPTEEPTAPTTEAPTEPPTEAPSKPLLDVKLELNWYDLTFGASNQATRLKANGIPGEDITWISDDPSIATVSETGLITPVSGGRTTIRAIYGDQEAVVKVNCAFR